MIFFAAFHLRFLCAPAASFSPLSSTVLNTHFAGRSLCPCPSALADRARAHYHVDSVGALCHAPCKSTGKRLAYVLGSCLPAGGTNSARAGYYLWSPCQSFARS